MSKTNGKNSGTPAKKNRLTQGEIKERRRQAMRLRVQGLSATAIAKLLQTSVATVSADLKVVQEENLTKVEEFQSNAFIAEALEKFELVEERAWYEYQNADPGSPMRTKALDLIRRIQLDKVGALSDVGLIRKKEEPTTVKHEHSVRFDLPPQARQKAARALLNETLQGKLAEPEPDGEPELDNVIEGKVVEEDENETETGTDP